MRQAKWLLLIHQLPPKPAYLRVKIRRRLQKLCAEPLKNSVYVLPNTADAMEDFHWLRREIVDAGGEATVSVADFVEGADESELEGKFRQASERAYAAFVRAARGSRRSPNLRETERLRARLRAITDQDIWGARGRGAADRALRDLTSRRTRRAAAPVPAVSPKGGRRPVAATWVTRRGVFVDRIASAWLIRRFIDPAARFKFVADTGYEPAAGELRFDMFEGEFTHASDRCTFETLLRRFKIASPALDAIAEIVHDIDLKVDPPRREETDDIRVLIRGICLTSDSDESRIATCSAILDGLYAQFSQETPARADRRRS